MKIIRSGGNERLNNFAIRVLGRKIKKKKY